MLLVEPHSGVKAALQKITFRNESRFLFKKERLSVGSFDRQHTTSPKPRKKNRQQYSTLNGNLFEIFHMVV